MGVNRFCKHVHMDTLARVNKKMAKKRDGAETRVGRNLPNEGNGEGEGTGSTSGMGRVRVSRGIASGERDGMRRTFAVGRRRLRDGYRGSRNTGVGV